VQRCHIDLCRVRARSADGNVGNPRATKRSWSRSVGLQPSLPPQGSKLWTPTDRFAASDGASDTAPPPRLIAAESGARLPPTVNRVHIPRSQQIQRDKSAPSWPGRDPEMVANFREPVRIEQLLPAHDDSYGMQDQRQAIADCPERTKQQSQREDQFRNAKRVGGFRRQRDPIEALCDPDSCTRHDQLFDAPLQEVDGKEKPQDQEGSAS